MNLSSKVYHLFICNIYIYDVESNQEELVKETKQYPSREIPNSGPYTVRLRFISSRRSLPYCSASARHFDPNVRPELKCCLILLLLEF